MELGTLDGILGCVSMGLGVTLMPEWAVVNSRYAEDLHTEMVSSHIAKVPALLVFRNHPASSKAVEELIQVID